MEAPITYRRPMPDEARAFAALHVQCWREAYPPYVPAELLAGFSVEKRLPMWEGVLATAERIVIGAYVDQLPVGFIIAGPTPEQLVPEQDGHVWALYIAAAQHRKGIGRELMAQAAAKWLGRGGTSLTVGVLRANQPARVFYESIGVELVKTGTYLWDGHELEDCIYVVQDLAKLAKLCQIG